MSDRLSPLMLTSSGKRGGRRAAECLLFEASQNILPLFSRRPEDFVANSRALRQLNYLKISQGEILVRLHQIRRNPSRGFNCGFRQKSCCFPAAQCTSCPGDVDRARHV